MRGARPAMALAVLVTTLCPLAATARAGTLPGFTDLMTDSLLTLTEPSVAKPAYLQPFTDLTFGTKVMRITGDIGAPIGSPASGTWPSDARHHYSKDQPWSADGSLVAIDNGAAYYLDGETFAPKLGHCSGYGQSDDRWHPSPAHPHERINVNGNQVMWYDVVQCVKTRSWTLPFSVDYMGSGEGNPSFDGRYLALSNGTQLFVIDMDPQPPFAPYPNSRIGPPIRIDDCGLSGCTVDWVSISPSGRYAVVSYDGDYPRVYDIDPNTLALTPKVFPANPYVCNGDPAKGFVYNLGHADMTLDPFDNNEDVLIGQEHCGNQGRVVNGQVMSGVCMVRLRDGHFGGISEPTNEAYPHHISARAYDRPGWVYVGYHLEPGKKFSDEIVALKIDGSRSVERLAYRHSAYSGCYRCESHAVPSRDGRRVIWASNWDLDCTTCGSPSDIKDYVVDVRAGATLRDTIPPAPRANLAVH